MALTDILNQILGNAGAAPQEQQIDQVARSADRSVLKSSVSHALNSSETPALGQTIGALFERATPEQRAAILDTLTQQLGPGALAGVAGGALAGHEGTDTPRVPAATAGRISPQDVQDVVAKAEQHGQGGLVDRVSDFYADHPELVKTLGAGALMVALAHMKNNLGR